MSAWDELTIRPADLQPGDQVQIRGGGAVVVETVTPADGIGTAWARFVPEQPAVEPSNVVALPPATATVHPSMVETPDARDPFACDFCDQVFGDRHTKRHHERISHRVSA